MTLWMIWASVVTALLGAAALAGERVLRSVDRPGRWVWVAAMTFALGLQGWSWIAPAEPAAGPVGLVTVPEELVSAVPVRPLSAVLTEWAHAMDRPARVVWVTGSLGLLLSLVVGVGRLRVRMRRWRPVRLQGEQVLLSPSFGPALVGVLKPWIVLPRWALALDDERLRLTFLHEAEHRKARDTWLLLAASLALVANPWNAAMWWCTRRLRHSVELDCDRRVLSRGIAPESYGGLLIELSAATPPYRLPVAALSNRTSLLERRLRMMRGRNRVSPVQLAGSLGAIAALTLGACEAPAPSSPQVDVAPTVTTTEEPVRTLVQEPWIFLDGERLGPEASRVLDELAPERIDAIEVVKGQAAIDGYGVEATSGVIRITTKPDEVVGAVEERSFSVDRGGEPTVLLGSISLRPGAESSDGRDEPTVYLDGVQVESIEGIDRADIDRVEVTGSEGARSVWVYTKGS